MARLHCSKINVLVLYRCPSVTHIYILLCMNISTLFNLLPLRTTDDMISVSTSCDSCYIAAPSLEALYHLLYASYILWCSWPCPVLLTLMCDLLWLLLAALTILWQTRARMGHLKPHCIEIEGRCVPWEVASLAENLVWWRNNFEWFGCAFNKSSRIY